MNIEAGILVRIIACNNARMKHMIGHVGHVIRPDLYRENHWYIEGADKNIFNNRCAWHASHLQPLSDHRKGSWSDLNEIWMPEEMTECH